MTEIGFYFSAPSRTGYACRLIRRAQRQGMTVTVTGPDEVLDAFDRELWTCAEADFIAHSRVTRAAAVPAALHASTVWLGTVALDAPLHDTLVNLGDALPVGFESFDRVFEIVSGDESDRLAARARWKGYASRGYPIKRHEVTA